MQSNHKRTIPGTVPMSAPLAQADWHYVDKPTLDEMDAADWALLDRQRKPYYAVLQPDRVLAMFSLGHDDPGYGYRLNNFQHCLQSATMAYEAGHEEETVAVALLHDIGFVACPMTHGPFAAALMGAYISERNHWMLQHHQIFQQVHLHDYPGIDPNERECWRGHPHFDWTAEFVAKFDQNTIDPNYPTAPLEFFIPMVRRLFARPPKRVPVD